MCQHCNDQSVIPVTPDDSQLAFWIYPNGAFTAPQTQYTLFDSERELPRLVIPVCAECGENLGRWECNRIDDAVYCNNCVEICVDCESVHLISAEEICYIEENAYCTNCYAQCTRCGESHCSGADLCRVCQESDDEESDDGESEYNYIHDYGYKPCPVFHRADNEYKDGKHLYMGIEIEVDDGGTDDDTVRAAGLDNSDLFYCKTDGSLDDGFEIVSHPGTWAFWKKYNWAFAGILRKKGYTSFKNDTCGMHVHVSRRAIPESAQFKLLAFFRGNPDLVLHWSRRQTFYALKKYADIDTGNNRACVGRLKGTRGERYTAINFKNSKTIEFRLFKGTLAPAGIRRNLALVVALCGFARETSMLRLGYYDFVGWLRERGATIIGGKDTADLLEWTRKFKREKAQCA